MAQSVEQICTLHILILGSRPQDENMQDDSPAPRTCAGSHTEHTCKEQTQTKIPPKTDKNRPDSKEPERSEMQPKKWEKPVLLDTTAKQLCIQTGLGQDKIQEQPDHDAGDGLSCGDTQEVEAVQGEIKRT